MQSYIIQLRGVRYCTAEVYIHASESDHAQELAVELVEQDKFIDWEESDVQDVVVESITLDPPADSEPEPMRWTPEQEQSAMRQGWFIVDNSGYGISIARHGTRFSSDLAAQVFVAHRAIVGDDLARAAWAHLSWRHEGFTTDDE